MIRTEQRFMNQVMRRERKHSDLKRRMARWGTGADAHAGEWLLHVGFIIHILIVYVRYFGLRST